MYLGVDIGGSHVSVGLVSDDGALIYNEEQPIEDASQMTAEQLVELIISLIEQVMGGMGAGLSENSVSAGAEDTSSPSILARMWRASGLSKAFTGQLTRRHICGIGVGCPGQSKDGVLVAASNLPLLKNAPLVDMLHSHAMLADTPIILLNDADAAVCAELWAVDSKEAYIGAQNVAMITLGTGIGLGLVLNGRLYQGGFGCVEGGHMIVDSSPDATLCGCGQRGCAEVYASAGNLSRIYEEEARKSKTLTPQATGRMGAVAEEKDTDSSGSGSAAVDPDSKGGSKRVFALAAADPNSLAARVLDQTCQQIARMCINLCRVVDPTVIVIGGGMSKAGDVLLDRVQSHIKALTWTVLPTDVSVVVAKSKANSGTIGAALASKNYAAAGGKNTLSRHLVSRDKLSWVELALVAAPAVCAAVGYGVAHWQNNASTNAASNASSGTTVSVSVPPPLVPSNK